MAPALRTYGKNGASAKSVDVVNALFVENLCKRNARVRRSKKKIVVPKLPPRDKQHELLMSSESLHVIEDSFDRLRKGDVYNPVKFKSCILNLTSSLEESAVVDNLNNKSELEASVNKNRRKCPRLQRKRQKAVPIINETDTFDKSISVSLEIEQVPKHISNSTLNLTGSFYDKAPVISSTPFSKNIKQNLEAPLPSPIRQRLNFTEQTVLEESLQQINEWNYMPPDFKVTKRRKINKVSVTNKVQEKVINDWKFNTSLKVIVERIKLKDIGKLQQKMLKKNSLRRVSIHTDADKFETFVKSRNKKTNLLKQKRKSCSDIEDSKMFNSLSKTNGENSKSCNRSNLKEMYNLQELSVELIKLPETCTQESINTENIKQTKNSHNQEVVTESESSNTLSDGSKLSKNSLDVDAFELFVKSHSNIFNDVIDVDSYTNLGKDVNIKREVRLDEESVQKEKNVYCAPATTRSGKIFNVDESIKICSIKKQHKRKNILATRNEKMNVTTNKNNVAKRKPRKIIEPNEDIVNICEDPSYYYLTEHSYNSILPFLPNSTSNSPTTSALRSRSTSTSSLELNIANVNVKRRLVNENNSIHNSHSDIDEIDNSLERKSIEVNDSIVEINDSIPINNSLKDMDSEMWNSREEKLSANIKADSLLEINDTVLINKGECDSQSELDEVKMLNSHEQKAGEKTNVSISKSVSDSHNEMSNSPQRKQVNNKKDDSNIILLDSVSSVDISDEHSVDIIDASNETDGFVSVLKNKLGHKANGLGVLSDSPNHSSGELELKVDNSQRAFIKPGKKWRRSLTNYRRNTMILETSNKPDIDDCRGILCTCVKCKRNKLLEASVCRKSIRFVPQTNGNICKETTSDNDRESGKPAGYVVVGDDPLSSPPLPTPAPAPDELCVSLALEKLLANLSVRSTVGLPSVPLPLSQSEPPSITQVNDTARDLVLRRCGQTKPLPFEECYPNLMLKNCHKIGEGVYGEVFLYRNRRGTTSVMKVIPIEGDLIVNGERQKKYNEIISEVIIATELSNLRGDSKNSTGSFNQVYSVQCVHGKYPERLLELWDLYNDDRGSENDCPDVFTDNQLYIVLELENGGKDLESFIFNNAQQAFSIFKQIACALAVAEVSLQFEHRDLHWGNVLISTVDQNDSLTYNLNGRQIDVDCWGVQASIIDFTLSRITYDDVCIYNDLGQDPDLFNAEGDYQFDIYRLMQKCNQNEWQHFEPRSNILWLHYVLDKMITALRYKRPQVKCHKNFIARMKEIKEEIRFYKSAEHFVTSTFV